MAVVINGTTGITSVNGSAASPSVTGTDTDTGIVYGTNTLSLATGGTTAVTVDSSQNTTLAGYLNAPNTFGFKNRAINGSFVVDQLSSFSSVTVQNSNNVYLVDRWWGYSFGANCTGQIITVSGLKRFRFTGAASVTQVNLGTRLESANTADMAGGTASLSLKASSTSLTSLTWAVYYANSTDNFGSLNASTQTLVATGSWTIGTTEDTYSTQISVPSAGTTGLSVQITGGALLAGQTLTLGDIQLEKSSKATSFDYRSIGTEKDLCRRYCQAVVGICAFGVGSTGFYGDANSITQIPLGGFVANILRSPSTASLTMIGTQGTDWALTTSGGVPQTGFTISCGGQAAVFGCSKTGHGLTPSNTFLYLLTTSGKAVVSSEL